MKPVILSFHRESMVLVEMECKKSCNYISEGEEEREKLDCSLNDPFRMERTQQDRQSRRQVASQS